MHTYIYTDTYIHTYIHIYIYIYTNTSTHIHIIYIYACIKEAQTKTFTSLTGSWPLRKGMNESFNKGKLTSKILK